MTDERLYQSIAGKIEGLIDSGKYPAGSRLPAERELAERFGVSRVAVREAQIALQAVGRIKIKTGSGAYVLDAQANSKGKLPNVSAFELTEARALF
jgi:DNA-binding FadR family transcriptional regulator